MFKLKQKEDEGQEFILPDTSSRIALASFYLFLITVGYLFYRFVVLTEIEKVKLMDFASRYAVMGLWINFTLGFFLIPAIIMLIFGIKIISDKRYPSLGARVAVKTRIIRGKKARNMGIKYLIFGLLALLIIYASIDRTARMRKSFAENPLKWAPAKAWEDAGIKRPDF